MNIANKKVLIKTWKEIKKASKSLGTYRQFNEESASVLFCKSMKPFCGTIVELDSLCRFDADKTKTSGKGKWTCDEWMIQEIIPECPESEEVFDYPLFKRGKGTGVIIKFTSLRTGIVVGKGEQRLNIGDTSDSFVRHTNTDAWEDVPYDSELGL